MPLFDFQCSANHVFEARLPVYRDRIRCRHNGCRKVARQVWLPPHAARDAQGFIPPVVFRNLKSVGAPYLFPGRSDKKTPAGYERLELNTTESVRKFEREYGEHERNKHHAVQEVEEARSRAFGSGRRSKLEGMAKDGPPQLRRYAERALERMDSRSFSTQARKFDPGFCVEAFSFVQSNRERTDGDRELAERARR